mmetsp:Transcript_29592/g.62761  ORF Transcript_29592/g.62761 Transcript_29592/m.62761 type:complete len:714 (+) Transcript_29592:229-2370(+)|eukprot:CAMPEP_0172325096 /NCGR_PEP_ID=MMETSP1058-20130122/53135_1 /TAXON_ID=83371 /ORGANISM="Detonula confervacea, Strain CCMP 353" /LENGTH=713 /DNA_ID=CAMNT_0013041553 /DNA_START=178 /DNA_END=2319 /DNA_ORIENTATION=-
MAVFPPIDSIASALSLILATLASLRAASRLEQRICNNGSIGLMDGPPILGPTRIEQPQSLYKEVPLLDDKDGIGDDAKIAEASPLWEHTEAFRRAVILGLIFEDASSDDGISNTLFSDITRNEGTSMDVRGGSDEDFAIAAAVEAGLLLPSSTRGGMSDRVRGGFQKTRNNDEDSSSSNPISIMTSWFVRELSAPLAVIPAWHGLLCSYLREQKETKLRKSQWCLLTPWERLRFLLTGASSGDIYDSSGLDFDASISGVARIPCDVNEVVSSDFSSATKTVRVKAFAPKTFRDLRTKCFRVKEKEYAQSILNAMNGEISTGSMLENGAGASIDMADTNHFSRNDDIISNVLQEVAGGRQNKNRIRRGIQTTLPYISFQSNSKGAARAGTFFFFTADGAYMIKTVKKEEAKAFLEMLPEYHRFMSENVNGRNSLLTRIFGMYSVQFPSSDADAQPSEETGGRWNGGLFSSSHEHISNLADDERVYLVMHSVFPSEASAFVTERFDLKGSTVGRECSLDERSSKGANAVLKDLDLKREVEEELNEVNGGVTNDQNRKKTSRYGICVGKRSKTSLMAQLERDVDLLHRCNVLDYSLLVGVADMEISNGSIKPNASSERVPKYLQNVFRWMDFPMPYYGAGTTKVDGGALSSLRGTRKGKQVMYYMGVIDFLQPWTVKKRMERDLKGLAGYDTSAISCVAPADYADRFLKFVKSHVT